MDTIRSNPGPVQNTTPAPGTAAPLESIDLLESQLARLRDACAEHSRAEDQLHRREAALTAREKDLQARLAEAQARELVATQRDEAAAARLAALDQRDAALSKRQADLNALEESLKVREQELGTIRARLDALRSALRSMPAGPAAPHASARPEELEALIASAIRRAVDTQQHADQIAIQLQAAERLAEAHAQRASESERQNQALQQTLEQAQSLAARFQAETESVIAELHARIKTLTRDRDALQARLDKITDRIDRAGLQIEWTPEPRKPGRSKKGG